MKKLLSTLLILALVFASCVFVFAGCGETAIQKHLILDANGNYGGTTNKELYGEGAPLNGQYDVKDSTYHAVNDYYNMKSTSSRTIFTNFQPYQQTMQDSSGIACALMLLNYFGEDVKNTYNEVALVEKYQQLNQTTVYGNGTTPQGLINLFDELGYQAESETYVELSTSTDDKIYDFNAWLQEIIDQGKFVLVRYRDDVQFGWHVIIGYDNMGTENITKDDVIIFADPWDGWDHYQDGYTMSGSGRFYRWWFEGIEYATNGDKVTASQTHAFENVIVTPKTPITFERVADTMTAQTVPEQHMLLNADGSYGGTTNAILYGTITEKNGSSDHLDKTYYKFVDYYNMTSTSTRVMLTNYRAYQQTMSSSCGIAATMSVLNYYGHDVVNTYNEIALVDKYHELNTNEPNIKGVGTTRFGLQTMLQSYGFNPTITPYNQEGDIYFDTYDQFVLWVKEGLTNGMPLTVCIKPHSGHWEVIIGYDDMGTPNYAYDDVIVLADPHDTFDHYQDGYNTFSGMTFFRQWYNGNYKWPQKFVVYPNK